jgi:hypothetical protein
MATQKKYTVSFSGGEIVRVDMHKSKEGYNYASVGIKKGPDNYVNIGYEWRGEATPDFVMDVMTYFQGDLENASVEDKKDVIDFIERIRKEM